MLFIVSFSKFPVSNSRGSMPKLLGREVASLNKVPFPGCFWTLIISREKICQNLSFFFQRVIIDEVLVFEHHCSGLSNDNVFRGWQVKKHTALDETKTSIQKVCARFPFKFLWSFYYTQTIQCLFFFKTHYFGRILSYISELRCTFVNWYFVIYIFSRSRSGWAFLRS